MLISQKSLKLRLQLLLIRISLLQHMLLIRFCVILWKVSGLQCVVTNPLSSSFEVIQGIIHLSYIGFKFIVLPSIKYVIFYDKFGGLGKITNWIFPQVTDFNWKLEIDVSFVEIDMKHIHNKQMLKNVNWLMYIIEKNDLIVKNLVNS